MTLGQGQAKNSLPRNYYSQTGYPYATPAAKVISNRDCSDEKNLARSTIDIFRWRFKLGLKNYCAGKRFHQTETAAQ